MLHTLLYNSEKITVSYDDMNNVISPITHKMVDYNNINRFHNLKDFFGKKRCVILFLPNKVEAVGHWVCLIKQRDFIEFFDPYGYTFNQLANLLGLRKTELFDNPQIVFNQHRFQKMRKNINDCGRHCAVRCRFANVSLKNYTKFIGNNNKMSADDLVTIMTMLSMPPKSSMARLLEKTK
tara:strand:- start:3054 stop:3593 length:540 start_codon:yes stop_codon:yes gene_type:complete